MSPRWLNGKGKWCYGPYNVRRITAVVDGKGPMFWLYKNTSRVNLKTGKSLHYNDPAEECHTCSLKEMKRIVESLYETCDD